MDNIGNIFAAYRKNLKYSQQDICDKLTGIGIPTKPAAYSTWETGNSIPNAVQFLAMCKIIGITDILNQFIGRIKSIGKSNMIRKRKYIPIEIKLDLFYIRYS